MSELRIDGSRAGSGCARYVVLVVAVAVLDVRLAGKDQGTGIFLSNLRPSDGAGDNILLGRKDDNGWNEIRRRTSVQARLYSRHSAGHHRNQDVEILGQYNRSIRYDKKIRNRRPKVQHNIDNRTGPGCIFVRRQV